MKKNAKGIVAAAIACALSAGTLAGTALASPNNWTDGAGWVAWTDANNWTAGWTDGAGWVAWTDALGWLER